MVTNGQWSQRPHSEFEERKDSRVAKLVTQRSDLIEGNIVFDASISRSRFTLVSPSCFPQ